MTYRNSANSKRGKNDPVTDAEWAAIRQAYEAKLTDIDIAASVGVSSKTIARWRWANDLPRNDR